MTVTTGARGTTSSGELSVVSTSTISCSNVRIWTSAPNSRASELAVSLSTVELMVIILPCSSSFLSTSLTRASSLSARSLTVMPSASVMFFVIGGGVDGASEPRGCSGRAVCRRPPPGRGAGGRHPPGCPGRAPPGGMPGRPGMPGRAPMPGCCGRTGWLGSGRGPPSVCGVWYDGRGPPGGTGRGGNTPGRGGATVGVPVLRRRAHDPRRAGTGGHGRLTRARLWRRRTRGRWSRRHRRVGIFDTQPQRRRDDTARRLVHDAGRQRNRGCVQCRLGVLGGDFGVGRPRRGGGRFCYGQFDLEFRFRGVRHVGDGHLFDRRVVDLDFRGRS